MSAAVYDAAVVGSGAAGSAAAARLARGGMRVLLVEQAEPAESLGGAADALARYYAANGFQSAFGGGLLPLPTGRALGGTTAINSGTCYKTPDGLLEDWQSRSAGRFSASEFRLYLDEAWRDLHVGQAPEATLSRSSRLVLAGLRGLGLDGGERLRRSERGCTGAGRCCFVCPTGAKMSADRAYLRPPPAGLELRCRTRLTGLRRGPPWTLELDAGDGGPRAALARRVVLAAGALASPYFVRRFRLGPGWRLAGDGLSVHPATKVFGLFDEPVRGWEGVPQGVGFEDEDPAIRYEGVYTPPEIAAVTLPFEGRRLAWWMDRYDRVATFGCMVRDGSVGRVRYPIGPSRPWIGYRLEDAARSRLIKAARTIGRVLFAAGARRVALPFSAPGSEPASAEELERADHRDLPAARLSLMGFHPLGTCAMGRVVDSELMAEPGLYVCDGSVVPGSLGVNPQITIYAFALRLAARLLEAR